MMKYNLSKSQREVQIMELLYPETGINNVSILISLSSNVHIKKIVSVLNELVKKNEILRIQVIDEDGIVKQYISDFIYQNIECLQLDMKQARELSKSGIYKFDDKLYRFLLFKDEFDKLHLIITFHHLVMDFWGIKNFFDQFSELLENNTAPVLESPLKNKFLEYLEDEEKYLTDKSKIDDERFWKDKLEFYDGQSIMDYTQNVSGCKRHTITLDRETSQSIMMFCNSNRVSINVLFSGALLLYSVY